MKKKQYVVIGVGRFGSSVAKTLAEAGHEVLIIDSEHERIQKMADQFTHAVVADTTDENTLRSLGVRNFDIVIVAIGQDMQASVLTVLLLKEIGVKYIVAKADSAVHGKMLEKVGADRVVYPQRDMGVRLAHSLTSTNVVDYFELAPDWGIIEVEVPSKLLNKNLIEADLRSRYGITVIAVKQDGKIRVSPNPTERFGQDDQLVMVGNSESIQRFEEDHF